jgi:BirA family biotin operon repressor/biotin-[acetyl-CoA-carboxylase] ligase
VSLGRPRVHLRRTGSTNERARELAFAGAPHGTLVTAAEQTAGRGRHGRRWSAPPARALLMSLVMRDAPPLLPLAAAVAVCDVVGPQAQIKWPNDIVVELSAAERGLAKLAGILIEGRPYPQGHTLWGAGRQEGWAVLGIGLNVAVRLDQLPPELRPGATERAGASAGLPAATLGREGSDVEPILGRVLQTLERRLSEPAQSTLEAWRARDALRGREIVWGAVDSDAQLGRGRAEGIDGTGRLLVALAGGGRTTIAAGEVHLQGLG